LQEEFKLTEDLFMTHQLSPDTPNLNLSPKEKMMLLMELHQSHTTLKLNLLMKFSRLSKFNKTGKLEATLRFLLLKLNMLNKPRMRRTPSELPDGFKNLEVSFTTDQLLRSTTSGDLDNHLLKPRKRSQLLHILHHNHTSKRKNL